MQLQENISLKPYHTFNTQVTAKLFAAFSSFEQMQELLEYTTNSLLILGGGSNILFTKNFDGLVVKNELKGIELVKEDDEFYYVKAAAGEVWHQLVLYCINNHYQGIENLSLIPGCVGASPIQNIGAYGVEVKDIFYALEAYHIKEKKIVQFSLADCAFGYRESVFKGKYKNQFVILNVTFRLNKKPTYHISYGAIEAALQKMKITTLSAKAISDAVIQIRSSKLPNPAELPNAGSFFKNPIISSVQFEELKKVHPTLNGYNEHNQSKKISAAWLIEQSGWKGYRKNDVGCHSKQALVLINYGNATGKEIVDLSKAIITDVQNKFGITLQREVNII
ncbi:MAG: UDP-N-acetylmuramate dehydrogenase [Chitinophagaceae bacterium]|nr:UDP-N-acetylmuramate dehydrogenase [Chitinophagaceae bacterium]MCW5904840.1 UDP-N-acetylmuramate dehydrogenase [Chitinophagaceae bacterium]